MEIPFLSFDARRRPKGWTSFLIFWPRLASRSIAPVKLATLRSPASFTEVIEAKSAFQEAWSCIFYATKARADGKAMRGDARQEDAAEMTRCPIQ